MKRYTVIWNCMCLTALLLVGCNTDENNEWSKNYDIEWPVSTIENVQPLSASPGETLTITGKNLQHTYYFYIGTVSCTIDSKSDTQLQIIVPAQVRDESPISVVNLYRRTFVYNLYFTPILP